MGHEPHFLVLVDGKKQKVIPEEHHGPSALERMGKLLEGKAVTVVTDEASHAAVEAALPYAGIMIANPMIGMAASLILAARSADPTTSLAIMVGENPGMRKETLDMVGKAFEGSGKDVAYPVAGGKPGYPIMMSPEGLEKAAESFDPRSDNLHQSVADTPAMSVLPVECRDVGIYKDLEADRAVSGRSAADQELDRGFSRQLGDGS